MKTFLAAVLAIAPLALAGLDELHTPWNEILSTHVKGDRVDYAGVLGDKAKLEAYLGSLAALDSNAVKAAPKAEREALYANAYNAAVFATILRNPAAGSVAMMGPQIVAAKTFVIAAESLSVMDIQRKKLFETSPDPLLWGVLNDGSLSAAPILPQALTSGNISSLAEQNTRAWLADTTRNILTPSASKVAQIPFDIYRFKPEFKSFGGGVNGFLKKYGPAGMDLEKNRPTYFYNAAKNAPAPAPKAAKGKGGKKK